MVYLFVKYLTLRISDSEYLMDIYYILFKVFGKDIKHNFAPDRLEYLWTNASISVFKNWRKPK